MYKKLSERVMSLLFDGDKNVLRQLKKQFDNSKVLSITETGKGVFIEFSVLKCDLRINETGVKKDFAFGDVIGTVDDILGAVGFVLFVKDGLLSVLEGYSNIPGSWSNVTEHIELEYIYGVRDMKRLEDNWREKDKGI